MQPQPVDDAEANIQNTTLQANRQPLLYCKLPSDVANRHCLLMDSILSSGYTVVRAIEMLLVRLPSTGRYSKRRCADRDRVAATVGTCAARFAIRLVHKLQ